MRLEKLTNVLGKVALQRIHVLDPQCLGTRLHLRGGTPLILDCLITTDMDGCAWEQFDDLGQDVFQKFEGVRFHIVEVGMHAPAGRHGRGQAVQ